MQKFAENRKSSKPCISLRIIGQDMHIMNPEFIHAVEQRDTTRLVNMVDRQVAAGAEALDLNLGSVRPEKIDWTIRTVRATADVPLFISSSVLSLPEILKRHQGWITVNSVTADPSTLARAMQKAREYSARLVVLLVQPGVTPLSVNERLQVAVQVLETAARTGLPITSLYLDPLFHLPPDPAAWQLSRGLPNIDSVLETISLLQQLAGERVRTLTALSSASRFLPAGKRAGLHQRLLPMLMDVGLDAVILNCHDKKLMTVAKEHSGNKDADLPLFSQSPMKLDTAAVPW